MRLLAAMAVLAATAAPVLADEMERLPPVANEAARKECGSCHMAYQPQLLPADGWRRLFADLGNHFGTDASLSGPVQDEIMSYYLAHAGRLAGTSPRITETPWWVRGHDEVRAAAWAKPEVKFKGNCTACHRQADQGIYEDD